MKGSWAGKNEGEVRAQSTLFDSLPRHHTITTNDKELG